MSTIDVKHEEMVYHAWLKRRNLPDTADNWVKYFQQHEKYNLYKFVTDCSNQEKYEEDPKDVCLIKTDSITGFNCYAHAVFGMVLSNYESFEAEMFCSSSIDYFAPNALDQFKNWLEKQMKDYGIKLEPIEEEDLVYTPPFFSWNIAVYIKPFEDFHFARQAADGYWYEKRGWDGKIFKHKTLPHSIDDYQLIGLYQLTPGKRPCKAIREFIKIEEELKIEESFCNAVK